VRFRISKKKSTIKLEQKIRGSGPYCTVRGEVESDNYDEKSCPNMPFYVSKKKKARIDQWEKAREEGGRMLFRGEERKRSPTSSTN